MLGNSLIWFLHLALGISMIEVYLMHSLEDLSRLIKKSLTLTTI